MSLSIEDYCTVIDHCATSLVSHYAIGERSNTSSSDFPWQTHHQRATPRYCSFGFVTQLIHFRDRRKAGFRVISLVIA
jgi:hypothetical protein